MPLMPKLFVLVRNIPLNNRIYLPFISNFVLKENVSSLIIFEEKTQIQVGTYLYFRYIIDALASIDARADDIKKSTVTAKELSNDVAKIKFAVEATKKSLDDLDSRRTKRDAENVDPEDMGRRLNILKNSASRFADMRANLTKIMKTVRKKLATVRKTVSRYYKVQNFIF